MSSLGSLSVPRNERLLLARQSRDWECHSCKKINKEVFGITDESIDSCINPSVDSESKHYRPLSKHRILLISALIILLFYFMIAPRISKLYSHRR
jgi:hypothetical protein